MKKTYEFETEPTIRYCVRIWTKKDGWKRGSPWMESPEDIKNIHCMLLGNGEIAKVVRRTAFYENCFNGYDESKGEQFSEDEMQRLLISILAEKEKNNDSV